MHDTWILIGITCGAYNPLGWQSRDDYRQSLRAFLFKIDNKGQILKSNKRQGGPALYDFGDRALWFAEGLYVPMSVKYMGLKRARSTLGSAYTELPNGETSLFGTGETELSELECYTSQSMLSSSKAMYALGSKMMNTKSSSSSSPSTKVVNIMTKFERFLFGDDQQ